MKSDILLGKVSHLYSISHLLKFPSWEVFPSKGNVYQLGSVSHLGCISQLERIFQGQKYEETLPRGIKTRKLFQKAIFRNSVKYSPLPLPPPQKKQIIEVWYLS